MNKRAVGRLADSLAEDMAIAFYSKMVLLKFLPEIKLMESGKLNGLTGSDIHEFLSSLS